MKHSISSKKIIISRTDSIGDVCLTLPLCRALKEKFPEIVVIFLGKTYTKPVIEACPYVDEFVDFSLLETQNESKSISFLKAIQADTILHVFPNKQIAHWAKRAGIPNRIGTSHRLFHWTTCNIRPSFTRKNSDLHEAQLNFELLKPLGIQIPSFDTIKTWHVLQAKSAIPEGIQNQFKPLKKVILHCKSQGSAVEWGLNNFMTLAESLAQKNMQVFFTGTENEGKLFRGSIPKNDLILDVSGQMSLDQLLTFIQQCDVLVAASTGPLHLAGLLNTKAIGLFSQRRPIHPGRWQALGEKSIALTVDGVCPTCAQGKPCDCIEKISVEKVMEHCL